MIQYAFPELTADEREFILTGISPEGWEQTFSGTDEDEEDNSTASSGYCPYCGGNMLGDGYTSVLHCENAEFDYTEHEPDSDPVYCEHNEKDQGQDAPKVVCKIDKYGNPIESINWI